MRFKVQDVYDEVYGHYYTEAVNESVEWTDEHDALVENVTSDLCRYIRESVNNFFNVEAPELPGLEINND